MGQQNGRERSSPTAETQRPRRASFGVSVLELEPDLGPLLVGQQLDQAAHFALPARTVRSGASVLEALEGTDAFGAVVLDGLLLHGTQIGKRPALRLVQPGDVVPFTRSTPPVPLATVSVRAATRSRLVLLDGRFLMATQRWPQLSALVYRRALESSEQLTTQLAISHLSRVDERLMSLMWLLAGTWGHVTSSGIRLRLALTHDALGELVGAQRPTVTLALKQLAERGSLIKQDRDWVILDPPPEPRAVELETPRLLDAPRRGSEGSPPAEPAPPDGRVALLRAELARRRLEYEPGRALARELADQARQLCARSHELVQDAHALSMLADAEQKASAAAANPPRDRLAAGGELQQGAP